MTRRHGFTLVELSIVLVIVGLLVGGILVGQSLIDSVKISRLVSDLRQYEVAVVQFQKKYKKYPGDSPYFLPPGTGNNRLSFGVGGTISAAGNGTGACSAAPNAALSNDENSQVFAHLSQARMLSKTYVAFSPATSCGGPHIDSITDASNMGLVYPYTELNAAAAAALGASKYPILSYKLPDPTNFYFFLSVNPLSMLALENKLGTQSYDGTRRQIGLANTNGVGLCNAGIACADSTAVYGQFYYLLPPQ